MKTAIERGNQDNYKGTYSSVPPISRHGRTAPHIKYATAAYFNRQKFFIRLFLVISFIFSYENSGENQDNNQYDDYYPNPVEGPASKTKKTASFVLCHQNSSFQYIKLLFNHVSIPCKTSPVHEQQKKQNNKK
jgi:hypothetical protein